MRMPRTLQLAATSKLPAGISDPGARTSCPGGMERCTFTFFAPAAVTRVSFVVGELAVPPVLCDAAAATTSTSSIITTASAPGGKGAPVVIYAASLGSSGVEMPLPARLAPTTLSVPGVLAACECRGYIKVTVMRVIRHYIRFLHSHHAHNVLTDEERRIP
eukprot:4853940-Pleurochrysis_carterae.AAC.4